MSKQRDEQLLRAGRMAEIGLLTASLAHELRQPLFAIRALAQLALARDSEEDRAKLLQELLSQTQHMEKILGDVGRAFQEQEEPRGPVDLGAPVRSAVEMLRHKARRAGVELALEDYGALPVVQGDPTALLQVAVNLIQNAVDASSNGSVVRIRMRSVRPSVVLEVLDEGEGIPPEIRERIFEPFFTTKDPGEGTGLGLHIARKLVEASGGELRVLEARRGAHIQVHLPVWKEVDAAS